MYQDFYSFRVQACKPTRRAHSHAPSTSWCKPISRQRHLDLKLFSDAVRQFIPTRSNLHGALSSWATQPACWDWMCVGKILPLSRLDFQHWVKDWLAVIGYWFPLANLVHSDKQRVNPKVPHSFCIDRSLQITNAVFWSYLYPVV